ncbi:MAG: glycosyl transferase [Candidatus Nealsonbacteria bacterium CG08_land_8_20_14_0_20_38_20]|uniref:Glycosyl transferase n=1 Tax=Candidatus Nealsonbacteria bacterium CG08_land_8_20_14_0_20_38_20 TaxID=1974705 RepID=A0A2H0YMR6_9BACT|nr:MAG: glycosyl transferase [Candidatus Nealsonbacteria bacterium CG08_land_8_20_14_0_20_38_20]
MNLLLLIASSRSIQVKENKTMKIALLAPFEESVPPKRYGGIEIIVYYLAQILTKKGHQVFLLATGDSKTNAKLIPIFPHSIRKEKIAQNIKNRDAIKYIGVGKIIKELKKIKIDIIHNHIGWRFLPFACLFESPTVTTLHGPLDTPYQQFIYGQFKKIPVISISDSQRKPFPNLNYAATIYNGIDIKEFEFNNKPKGDYFAFLARMSPEKGPVQAIQAAKKAGVKLKMAAKVDAVDKEYFDKEVKPFIDGEQIKFLGEIKINEKSGFLRNAKGLLAPLRWEEPFGLFMTEAMACGTPVIVFDRGSARELVNDEKSGFVVKELDENDKPNVNGLIEAIKKIGQIDRQECRRWVEEKFTIEKMVDNYEKLFYKILKKHGNI